MAHSVGVIYAELDLDTTKYTKAQQGILHSAKSTALNVEQNWKILGQKSDVIYDAMRRSATNAYEMIKNKAGTSAAEIVRAHEAMNAKIKAANEGQFGHQASLIESIKKNWVALSAAAIAAYMVMQRLYSTGREIASMANDIERMSKTIGISTVEWQKFSYAAKMSDVSNETLMRGMKGLSQSMEEFNKKSGDGYQILTALGLSTVDATGKQKSLTQMFKEVATEFSKYDNGARMVDYANKLLGKSGMDLIPMFEKGGKGIDEHGEKLVKMGSLIGEVAIKAGSAAEDQFKELETRFNSMKINMSPLVLEFVKFADAVLKGLERVKGWLELLRTPVKMPWWLGGDLFSTNKGKFPTDTEMPLDFAASHGPGYTSTGKKSSLPALPDTKAMEEAARERKRLLDQGNEDYFKGVEERLKVETERLLEEDKLYKKSVEDRKRLIEQSNEDYFKGVDERLKEETDFIVETNKLWEKDIVDRKKLIEQGNEDYFKGVEARLGAETERLIEEDKIYKENKSKLQKQAEEIRDFWAGIGTNMGQQLTSGFFNLFTDGLKDAGDAFKKFGENLLNTFMNVIQQLISNWLMFGSVMGAVGMPSSGFQGLLGPGVFNLVTPKGSAPAPGGGQGGGTFYVTNNYIDAIDVQSIEDRVTGPVIRGMSSAKNKQSMKNLVRRNM